MDNCLFERAKELFGKVEFASVGLGALADLMETAGDEVTDNDGFIDSLARLLRIVAKDLMNTASDGYLLKNQANPAPHWLKNPANPLPPDSPKESA